VILSVRKKSPGFARVLSPESSNSKAVSKIRTTCSSGADAKCFAGRCGGTRGCRIGNRPEIDKVIEDFFQAQLLGKARNPRIRQVCGSSPASRKAPKKIEEKKEAGKGKVQEGAAAANSPASRRNQAAPPKQEAARPGQPLPDRRLLPATEIRRPKTEVAREKRNSQNFLPRVAFRNSSKHSSRDAARGPSATLPGSLQMHADHFI